MAEEILDTEEVPTCCLCGQSGVEQMFVTWDRLHGFPGRFSLVRCTTCGLVRLSPRPARHVLGRYYPDDTYYAYRPETPRDQSSPGTSSIRARLQGRARSAALTSLGYPGDGPPRPVAALTRHITSQGLLKRVTYGARGFPHYVPGGRALDVGCGNGAFLAVLQRHGWDVYGVDISMSASRSAAARGITVHVGELEGAPVPPRSLDYLRMTHVIEHVWDPVGTLKTAYEYLRPGGTLYLETPNISSLAARHCGPYWFPLETPRHLWLFDPDTVRRALRTAGLEVTELSSDSFGARPLSAYRWESTFMTEEQEGRRLPNRPVPLRPQAAARAAALSGAARVMRMAHQESDEILCCWARRPVGDG